jgi:uncharacterized repeat protein (TIGR01451 family)
VKRPRVKLRIESLEDRSNPVTITPDISPTTLDNDYTRIQDAVNSALDGDTIELIGAFDFTEANAAASWALGSDGTAGTFDDYSVYVPENLTGVIMSADALGDATIQGPGDLPGLDLEGFLYFDGLGYQGWTVSNLEILDFDMAIGMFSENEFDGTFDNVVITNNRIRLSTDLNGVNNPNDQLQNVGIHFSFGKNQTISDNTIEIPGDGVSSSSATAGDFFANPHKFATSVGIQSRNAAGDLVDNLIISGNVIRVLNEQSAFPERVIGIWENTTAYRSDITVTDNQFLNDSPDNDPSLNRQQAFWVTTHSNSTGGGTTVTYSNNSVTGAALGFRYTSDYDFSADPANTPIEFQNNTLTDVSEGFLIQNNGQAHLTGNAINGVGIGQGAGAGVTLRDGSALDFDTSIAANTVSGFATGLQIEGQGRIDGGTITGNGIGIAVVDATAVIQNTDLQNNSSIGLRISNGAIVDAGQVATMSYTPVDFTGLGISAGGNNFIADYSPSGALAIVNANTGSPYNTNGPNGLPFDVTAHGNLFSDVSASVIESVVLHDFDDPSLGYIDIASSSSFSDLSVSAEFVTAPAFIDQRLTLLVKVTNFGPSAAGDVEVTVPVPAGSTFLSVVTSQGTASHLLGTVTAQLGSMPSGSTAIVRLVVRPTGIGPLLLSTTATATATLGPADPNLANNSSFATVTAVDTPGGIVKISQFSGIFFLVGDSVENAVQIVAGPSANSFTAIGLGGTQIQLGNVIGPTATVNGIVAGIDVDLGVGNDTVIIDGSGANTHLALSGGIAAELTNGNDVLYTLHLASTLNLIATGGAGANRVRIAETTYGGGVQFNSAGGIDLFHVSDTTTTGGIVYRSGVDSDQLTVERSTIGKALNWNAEAGNDVGTISDTIVGEASSVFGLDGVDALTLVRTTYANAFTWDGGIGNDTLDMTDVVVTAAFQGFGAQNDDTITALRTAFNSSSRFDGGAGTNDTLDIGSLSVPVGTSKANTFAINPVVVGFEVVLS